MAFDGYFISKLIKEFDVIKNTHLNNINYDKNKYIFNFGKKNLIISFNANKALCFLENKVSYNFNNDWFSNILNSNLKGSKLIKFYQYKTDRIIFFEFLKTDIIYGPSIFKLIFEATGKYANLFLINKEDIVVSSLKKVNIGQKYNILESDKLDFNNFNSYENIIEPKDIFSKYMGISLVLANYLFDHKLFLPIKEYKPVFNKTKNDFYLFDLYLDEDEKIYFNDLNSLLKFYIENQKSNKNDFQFFLEQKLKKVENKIIELNNEMEEKKDDLKFKGIADSLYMENDLNKKISSYNGFALDENKTINENAQNLYDKYKKAKRGIIFLEDNLKKVLLEKEKVLNLITELQFKTKEDNNDIIDLLIPLGYKTKNKNHLNKKIPNYGIYKFNDFEILVGRNMKQNEYLLRTSSKNYYWFHIKAGSGSHVILKGSLTNESIKYAATLAVMYSTQKYANNVAVDYTTLNYVSRIRKENPYLVKYINYKTIYITVTDEVTNILNNHKF